jgi:hypothetical protein
MHPGLVAAQDFFGDHADVGVGVDHGPGVDPSDRERGVHVARDGSSRNQWSVLLRTRATHVSTLGRSTA